MEQNKFRELFQDYTGISKLLEFYSYQDIISAVSGLTSISSEELEAYSVNGCSKEETNSTYRFVLEDLLRNVKHYNWLYERLEDDCSRMIFTRLMQFRLVPDLSFLDDAGTISLDEDIHERVTFTKMKIEGIPAVLDAKNYIKNDNPKFAVSLCCAISDIWEIPKLIDSINPTYQFHLRHYMKTENWETVLYAIPAEQKPKKEIHKRDGIYCRRKKIVAMAPYERGWSNVELIKDCGLIPYLLYKKYGYDVSMVGADGGPYPYHEKYTRGVNMEFLPNGQVTEKVRYLENHAQEIDGLLLRGCYPTNFPVAKAYKILNPKGRIYVGLDANSWWMDRILWDEKEFTDFMNCCDVIATSCHAMQRHLNEKWPWKIEYIPNGHYDFSEQHRRPDFQKKKNVILTVGRLGTQQKATEVLLEAFAKASDKIPGWQLRLAGSVEDGFQTYIKEYFTRFPELSERVRFIGAITDREKLSEEYQAARIFALTSALEGGTPNVIAEALHAGCVTAVTRIDAYEDATDYGRCGKSAQIGDVEGFAEILYQLCTDDNPEQLSAHAYEYSRTDFDMEKITAKVNELLFGRDI